MNSVPFHMTEQSKTTQEQQIGNDKLEIMPDHPSAAPGSKLPAAEQPKQSSQEAATTLLDLPQRTPTRSDRKTGNCYGVDRLSHQTRPILRRIGHFTFLHASLGRNQKCVPVFVYRHH
jgi:hypothetical protein